MNRRAVRLEVAELDQQKVIFAQTMGKLFFIDLQELKQLLVRKEMPIAANERDVTASSHLGRDLRIRRQAEGGRDLGDVLRRCFQHIGQTLDRDEAPVSPDHRVQRVGEVIDRDRSFGGDGWQTVGQGRGGCQEQNGKTKRAKQQRHGRFFVEGHLGGTRIFARIPPRVNVWPPGWGSVG